MGGLAQPHGAGQLVDTEGLAATKGDAHFGPSRLTRQSAQGWQVGGNCHNPRVEQGQFGAGRKALFLWTLVLLGQTSPAATHDRGMIGC